MSTTRRERLHMPGKAWHGLQLDPISIINMIDNIELSGVKSFDRPLSISTKAAEWVIGLHYLDKMS
jgi:hypothetical protein